MRKPILTLTTDFGLSDHYVGAMKGVIARICPQAQIVDITHEVAPYQITEGAFVVSQTYRWYPKRTIHVVVVDPGVGTSRRPIVMEAAGQLFVAPDNGVLSMVYSREKHKIRLISNDYFFQKPVSQTFHGRDIFAPVGAHLAAGVLPSRMGKLIQDYLRPSFETPVQTGKHTWSGSILKIDRFGNLVTNFETAQWSGLDQRTFVLSVGLREISVLARNYAESKRGELFVIGGSSGFLEVSLNQGSAAQLLGCAAGSGVDLSVW